MSDRRQTASSLNAPDSGAGHNNHTVTTEMCNTCLRERNLSVSDVQYSGIKVFRSGKLSSVLFAWHISIVSAGATEKSHFLVLDAI